MLSRLLEEGWLTDGWEDPTTIHGRPPRRYYEITKLGCARFRTSSAPFGFSRHWS
ncbi:helix-turn-helix transcriptional regulator [Actinophytocola algeriensis]|uniref:helix-turn-helix transcriptional regulator n=1 Tax=Actinophytocola algeriensis TaxID=1768010 RepID=UPI0016122841